MLAEDPVQELVGRLNLVHGSRPRNDNLARTKDTHRNAFTLSISVAVPLTLTECAPRTGTYPRVLIVRIVEEFRIHPLIDCLLQHTEEVVLLDKQAMEIVLLNIVVERIVCVNEGGVDLHGGRGGRAAREGTSLKRLDDFQEPLDGADRELAARHSRHLNAPIPEQLHIDLLEAIAEGAAKNESRLIVEGLVRGLAIGEQVLVAGAMDLLLVFELQDAYVGNAYRNELPFQLVEENVQLNR